MDITYLCTWCHITPVVKRPVAYNVNLRDPVVVRCPECGVMVLSEGGKGPAIAMWNELQERELKDIKELWRKAMRDYYCDKERI